MAAALIQKSEITEIDKSSVFFIMIAISLILASTMTFFASEITKFFGMTGDEYLIGLMGINLIILNLGTIQNVNLAISLDYRFKTIINLVAIFISGTVGIILAINNLGLASLVIQVLLQSTVTTSLLWIRYKWRPLLVFDFRSIFELYSYGMYYFLTSFINRIYGKINNLIVGKFYNSTILGLYSRAEHIKSIPLGFISKVVSNVTFPAFSQAKFNKALIQEVSNRSINLIVFILYPIIIFLFFQGENTILLLLGGNWDGTFKYLAPLLSLGFIHPFLMIDLNIIKAVGEVKKMFYAQILIRVGTLIAILFATQFDFIFLVYCYIASEAVYAIFIFYYAPKLINTKFIKQIESIKSQLIPLIIFLVVVILSKYLLFPYIRIYNITLSAIFAFSTYIIVSHLVKSNGLLELKKYTTVLWKK